MLWYIKIEKESKRESNWQNKKKNERRYTGKKQNVSQHRMIPGKRNNTSKTWK